MLQEIKSVALLSERSLYLFSQMKFFLQLFGNVFFVDYFISEAGMDIFRSKKLSDITTFYPNPSFIEEPAKAGVNSFSNADIEKLILSGKYLKNYLTSLFFRQYKPIL